MTKQIVKYGSVIILVLMGFIQGCSISSPLFSYHPDRTLIILDSPPNRMFINGSMDEDDRKLVDLLTDRAGNVSYQAHHYNERIGANIYYDATQERINKFDGSMTIDKQKKGYKK